MDRMKTTAGVIAYNKGEKCVIRMLVMLHSLRKHYKGPVTVLAEGPQFDWFRNAVKALGCCMVDIHPREDVPPLVRKAQLQDWSPYDLTMFLDADTVVMAPIENYFDKIAEFGFCTGEFAGWRTDGPKMTSRIKAYSRVCSEQEIRAALNYGKAVNTGVFGFRKNSEFLTPWRILTYASWQAGCSRIPDEVSCQMLLPRYRHWIAPVEWGVSVKHGRQPAREDCVIIHYHGRKHASDFPACTLWKAAFWELLHRKDMAAVRAEVLKQQFGDRRLTRYLKSVRNDITVVSAVNPPYLASLKANMPAWMETPGIMEHPGILFYNGLEESDLSFVPAHWRLVKWSMPVYESPRELMLSAFVLGAAKEVTTDYWVKIDADVKPAYDKFAPVGLVFPSEAFESVLAAHKWGYTKPGKWLRRLEDWYDRVVADGRPRLFTEGQLRDADLQKRYGHPRIASFLALHQTSFVKEVAKLCGDRLPVPSHDTLLWFMAARGNRPISRLNLKESFAP